MRLNNPSFEVIYCINLASNYILVRFIRFVSPFTDSSRNAFFISSRFKSPCRYRNFFLEFGILQPNTGQANLCLLIGIGRISSEVNFFLRESPSRSRGSNIYISWPLSKVTYALKLLRREPFLNVRQQSLKSQFS